MNWKSKRLAVFVITLILCMTTQSGCWSQKELDELAIVIAVGLDLDEQTNQIKLTAQIVRPEAISTPQTGGGGEQQKTVYVTTVTGKTVFDAVRNMTFHTPRQLYWAHNEIIVVGRKLAEQGISGIIDVFVRNVDMRRQVWLLVAEPSAEAILKHRANIEQLPGQEIASMIETRRATSQVVGVTLHQFLNNLLSPTADSVATPIMIQEEHQEKRLHIYGAAAFDRDRLVGYLNGHETRGLMWILNQAQGGVLVAEQPELNLQATMELIQSSSKPKAQLEGEKITVEVKVNVTAVLDAIDTADSPTDLTKAETMNKLEQAAASKIASDIQAALKKAQELQADILGMGELVHRTYPKQWSNLEKRWDDLFLQLEVEPKVKVTIRSTGLTTKTILPR